MSLVWGTHTHTQQMHTTHTHTQTHTQQMHTTHTHTQTTNAYYTHTHAHTTNAYYTHTHHTHIPCIQTPEHTHNIANKNKLYMYPHTPPHNNNTHLSKSIPSTLNVPANNIVFSDSVHPPLTGLFRKKMLMPPMRGTLLIRGRKITLIGPRSWKHRCTVQHMCTAQHPGVQLNTWAYSSAHRYTDQHTGIQFNTQVCCSIHRCTVQHTAQHPGIQLQHTGIQLNAQLNTQVYSSTDRHTVQHTGIPLNTQVYISTHKHHTAQHIGIQLNTQLNTPASHSSTHRHTQSSRVWNHVYAMQ